MTITYLGAKRLQGTKFDRVNNSLGSSADGTNNGITLDTTNEKLGTGCYSFDGSNDTVNLGTDLDTILTGDFSFTTWAYMPNATSSGNKTIICKPATTSWANPYHSFTIQHTGGNIDFQTNNGSTNVNIDLACGQGWHHIAVTKSGTTFTLYIDGTTSESQTISGTAWGTQDWIIGNTPYNTRFFDGDVDDMSFWSRALTATEIGKLVNSNQSPLGNWVNGNSTYFYPEDNTLYVKSDTDNIQTNITYDLTTNDSITVANSWVLQFKADIKQYSANTSTGQQHRVYIGLSSGTNVGEPASNDELMVDFEARSDQQDIGAYNYDGSTQTYTSTGQSMGTITRWIRLIRNANTSFTVELYDNEYYTGTPTTATANANLSSITGLKYITVRMYQQTSSGTINMEIDDMKFYNDQTSPTTLTKEFTFTQGSAQLVSSLTNKSGGKAYYSMDTAKPISASTSQITTVNTGQQITQGADQLRRIDLQDSSYLGETLGNTWTIRCVMDTQAISLPTDNNYQSRAFGMGLSSTEASVTSNSDRINWGFRTWDSNGADEPDNIWGYSQKNNGHSYGMEQFTTNLVPSVAKYYVEINRLSDTSLTMTIRTDSHSGTIVRQQTFTGLPSDVTGLRYLQFYQYRESANNNTTVTLVCSDIEIWNSSTSASGTADATISCHDFGCNNDFSSTSDLVAMTNLPVNTIFEQTDSTPSYWWYSGSAWLLDESGIFSDNFSSDTWTGCKNSACDSGSPTTIDISSGALRATTVNTNSDDRLHKALGFTLSNSKWLCQFEVTPSSSNHTNIIALTDGFGNLNAADGLLIDYASSKLKMRSYNGSSLGLDSTGITTSTGTKYYVTFSRLSETQVKLIVRTGSHTGTEVGSETGTISSSITDMDYVQSGAYGRQAGDATYVIDNLKVWNNISGDEL